MFCKAVNDNGQQWPPGWVKGQGYIDPSAGAEERYIFKHFAAECIKNRTGIEERYRQDCVRELETYLNPTFGNCDIRSTEHFSKATVGAWVNAMAKTHVFRGSKRKLMSPKTLKNLHGLLSSILNEAVVAEPPLRDRNPCHLTRLPRTDEAGIEDDEASDEMEFLTPEEVAGLVECLKRPEDKVFVRVAYGTGMRWGEITALAKRHATNPAPGEFLLKVTRAWKRKPEEGFVLGKPKSKQSRRAVDISAGLWRELLDYGLAGMASNHLIFHNGKGERLVYSTFYDRWIAAVAEAKERGLLPDYKFPTFHDLRHSHAAAVLSDRHSLTYLQRRLGHESIKTTSDRYGHLLKTAHEGALVTIDRALGITSTDPAVAEEDIAENVPVRDPGQSLYVAHVGSKVLGFWNVDHAEETAARWAREHRGAVRVEKWSCDWWIRMTGGHVGSDCGLRNVRDEVPHRAWIWTMGPAVYAADGTDVTFTWPAGAFTAPPVVTLAVQAGDGFRSARISADSATSTTVNVLAAAGVTLLGIGVPAAGAPAAGGHRPRPRHRRLGVRSGSVRERHRVPGRQGAALADAEEEVTIHELSAIRVSEEEADAVRPVVEGDVPLRGVAGVTSPRGRVDVRRHLAELHDEQRARGRVRGRGQPDGEQAGGGHRTGRREDLAHMGSPRSWASRESAPRIDGVICRLPRHVERRRLAASRSRHWRTVHAHVVAT
ncbi:site-specific integrase [Streptomyces vastus]|uniref:Tyr recombinase domain-containing protein n=1 Tax=Streptomyces vastus TaxID=285451 RepID=A0ABP6CQL8_9ACTN